MNRPLWFDVKPQWNRQSIIIVPPIYLDLPPYLVSGQFPTCQFFLCCSGRNSPNETLDTTATLRRVI